MRLRNWSLLVVSITVLGVGSALSACGSKQPTATAPAAEAERDSGKPEHASEEADEDAVTLARERWSGLGIETANAGPAEVVETVPLTGRVIIDPLKIASVRARFPGPVTRIYKDVGQPVRAGESLADVESNESLTVYAVRSPQSGLVLERLTNVGDVAGTETLFRVGDTSTLQVELLAFPGQRGNLRAGALSRLNLDGGTVESRIGAIVPEVEGATQGLRVRVPVPAASVGGLVPGQYVSADVETARARVPVAVDANAVTTLEGSDRVFVPTADGAKAQRVKLGRRGATSVEILEGLTAGAEYIRTGTFVFKAEIGKNSAAHED